MRLLFAGTPQPAVASLTRLATDHEVVGVLTMPDARGKRGKTLHPSPVALAAQDLDIPVYKTASLKEPETQAWIASHEADAVAVVAYGALVPASAFDLTHYGWINLHFSLLPAYRGAAPVQRMIEDGAAPFGVTVFQIDAGLDTGPIFRRESIELSDRVTSGQALTELAEQGAVILSQTLTAIEEDHLSAVAQDEDGISHAPQLTPAQGQVNWQLPAAQIDRHIRAFTPDPGAWTRTSDGTRIKILAAREDTRQAGTEPATFEEIGGDVIVATGAGSILLEEIAPAGKKAMPASAWLRGWRGEKNFEVTE